LPPCSFAAYYYLRGLKRFVTSARAAAILLREPHVARHLLRRRAELIELIETEREEFLQATAGEKEPDP
jgi:hypothetical protein